MSNLSNSYRRFVSLSKIMNGNVDSINSGMFTNNKLLKIDYHFNFGFGILFFNLFVLYKLLSNSYRIVIIDNRNYLFKCLKFKDTKWVNLLTDDPFGKYFKSWKTHVKNAKCFDYMFVQRKENVSEFLSLGVKKVELSYRSYDQEIHNFLNLDKTIDVLFIGSYEKERDSLINSLANKEIKILIHGNGWENSLSSKNNGVQINEPIYLHKYVEQINKAKVCLHFVRKANRDEQDSRFFELAACGACIVSEYTEVQSQILKDLEEILYFNNSEELNRNVKILLSDDKLRNYLSRNVRNKILETNHSHKDRWKEILQKAKINY